MIVSTTMQRIQYHRDDLYSIRDSMVFENQYEYLKREAVVNIRNFGIKKRKRGKRGGAEKREKKRREKLKNRQANLNNIITIQLNEKQVIRHSSMINISTINCQSIRPKEDYILSYIVENKLDLVVLTETWLNDTDPHKIWIQSCGFNKDTYRMNVSNRHGKSGGGLALVYNQCLLKIRQDKCGSTRSFEYAVWKILMKGECFTLIGIYHPPYSTANKITMQMFLEDFTEWLSEILPDYNNIFMTGDFNIQVNDYENENTCMFNDILQIYGLKQHVKFATHKLGNTLDLVITECISKVDVHKCVPGMYFSDHCSVNCVTKIPKPDITVEKIRYRKLRTIDVNKLIEELECDTLQEIEDLDNLVDTFESRMENSLNKLAPEQHKQICIRSVTNSWFSAELAEQKRKIRRLERHWNKFSDVLTWEELKQQRLIYKYMIMAEKKKVIHNKVLECGNDNKKLYSLVNYLTGDLKNNPLPEHSNDKQLADDFVEYFLNKIDTIRESIKDHDIYLPSGSDHVPTMDSFTPMSRAEILKIANSLKTKSCELDKWPTSILKRALPEIIGIVEKIINMSLKNGVFVKQWKKAVIRPLLKKLGADPILSNYRPVSNLAFLGKLLEKCALYHINNHCKEHNLLPDYQSAYRENFSCETALVKLTNDILWSMERGRVTSLVAIDLSAAFDTVDYEVMDRVLEVKFGLKKTVSSWISTYLQPRTCRVNVGDSYSAEKQLKCGVPQGSCMGPYLYLMYASTLHEVIPESIQLHGYADDHAFKTDFIASKKEKYMEDQAKKKLEKCALSVGEWMSQNKLKMNNTKTEVINFSSRQQAEKIHNKDFDINGSTIKVSENIKYLGAYLDSELKMDKHIIIKCRTAMWNIQKLKQIRKFLTMEACHTLVKGLVLSHLDYSNAILAGQSKSRTKKMQMVQNAAAKLVFNKKRRDSATQCLYNLHWLPIEARIQYKVCTLVYKCRHGQAPDYLCELLEEHLPARSLRSEQIYDRLKVPKTTRKTFADKSFSVIGPKMWNELPNYVKESGTLHQFKFRLKATLFNCFYKNCS